MRTHALKDATHDHNIETRPGGWSIDAKKKESEVTNQPWSVT